MRINREWKKRQQFRKDTDDRKIKMESKRTRQRRVGYRKWTRMKTYSREKRTQRKPQRWLAYTEQIWF